MLPIMYYEGLALEHTLTPLDNSDEDLAFVVNSRACVALAYAKAVSVHIT